MIQNKTQVETVNFRLYFKVIFKQNEHVKVTEHLWVLILPKIFLLVSMKALD
jgi:hypothetical protein